MTTSGYTLFETQIGHCGIAWNDRGITRMQLPEANPQATEARMCRRLPGVAARSPGAEAQQAILGIVALLRGQHADLRAILLDMAHLPVFHQQVYAIARSIPAGTTLTYGEIARKLGAIHAARAVGQALGQNPFAIIVPCHRVLAAGGKPGGFSAGNGVATKLKLLAIEGAIRPVIRDLFEDTRS